MRTTTLYGFKIVYDKNTNYEVGEPIYAGWTEVNFIYENSVEISLTEPVTEPKGILNLPEVEILVTGGSLISNPDLNLRGTAANLKFVDGSFALLFGVYSEREEQDYILLIDSSPGFKLPTDQYSFNDLLSKIEAIEEPIGNFAPNVAFSLSSIPASVTIDSDLFNWTDGDDVINGTDGDDILTGGAGNDTLFGGSGDDIIWGQDGNDILDGGDGNDILRGGAGDDLYFY
ncbi:MAG: calcium-binding protein, partial [Alphaproteobacteria bacterium]|nr:calcium-binding protein [Alphaproteobacteria bacterium]